MPRNSDPPRTLQDLISGLAVHGEAPAVIAFSRNSPDVWSFARMASTVAQLSAGLIARGLRPGQPVGLLAPNSPRWVVTYLAVVRAGAIAMPADQLDSLKKLGIQSLTIKNSADGLNLSINGKELPSILWNRGEFANLATLGIEAGVLKTLANLDDGTLDTLKKVADAAPILQTAKLDVTINLPQ